MLMEAHLQRENKIALFFLIEKRIAHLIFKTSYAIRAYHICLFVMKCHEIFDGYMSEWITSKLFLFAGKISLSLKNI